VQEDGPDAERSEGSVVRLGVAAEALEVAIPLGILTLVALRWAPWLAPLPAALLCLGIWFFRDPERRAAGDAHAVLSPADGRVVWVREVDEPRFLQSRAVAVSIFLSLLDVHINRAPVAGEIAYRAYVRGRFDPANRPDVGMVNERLYTGIQADNARVLVVQIAGRVARRIVTRVRVGDRVQRGQRIGLIRFGSCTQTYLPAQSEVLVRAGDRVRGGETVIARLPP
jgi:phosphatidylserine decarboxylase